MIDDYEAGPVVAGRSTNIFLAIDALVQHGLAQGLSLSPRSGDSRSVRRPRTADKYERRRRDIGRRPLVRRHVAPKLRRDQHA